MTKEKTLTRDMVLASLVYDPVTGIFVRIKATVGRPAGSRAGTIEKDGYRQIVVNGVNVKEHRLAWFLMTGCWPEKEIDHENWKRDDNRWTNLRQATFSQNKVHQSGHVLKKSGLPRCVFHSKNNKYRVICCYEKKAVSLGTAFETIESAVAARDKYENEHRGSWSGRKFDVEVSRG